MFEIGVKEILVIFFSLFRQNTLLHYLLSLSCEQILAIEATSTDNREIK